MVVCDKKKTFIKVLVNMFLFSVSLSDSQIQQLMLNIQTLCKNDSIEQELSTFQLF